MIAPKKYPEERPTRAPRFALWMALVANICTFASQVISGLDRPDRVIVACLSVVVGLAAAVVLWVRRKGDHAGQGKH